jgi:putative MATE family efflux protein
MARKSTNNDNNLTSGPILPKIVSLAGPLMIIAILQTTQSLIDMFWVGRLGASSIAAVAMSGTIIMVLFTIIMGISTGTLALVARYVGAKDREKANAVATQSIYLAITMSSLMVAIGLMFTQRLFLLLGASQEVLEAGVGYLKILLMGGITMFLLFLGNSILRGAGDTVTPMKLMVLANLINIVLDPIFIFGLGVPRMNTSGAAVATVISQAVSALLILWILSNGRYIVHIRINELKIRWEIIKAILKIGLPSSLQMFFRSLMGIVLMGIVATFGTLAVAAYGVGMRLQMVVLMPAFALGGSAATLVGQNLGASLPVRAKRCAWAATIFDLIIMAIIAIVFFLFASQIIGLFNKNPRVISLGVQYLRITTPFYIFVAFGIVLNRALAGAGETFVPMIITLLTLWGFQIPMALFLSKRTHLGLTGIWMAIALAFVLNGLLILGWFELGRWKKRAAIEPISY